MVIRECIEIYERVIPPAYAIGAISTAVILLIILVVYGIRKRKEDMTAPKITIAIVLYFGILLVVGLVAVKDVPTGKNRLTIETPRDMTINELSEKYNIVSINMDTCVLIEK